MPARSMVHLLIALLALIASEPFHLWIHGEHGVAHSGHQEIHDGACEHLPDHRGHDDCLLCIGNHGHAIAQVRGVANAPDQTTPRQLGPVAIDGKTNDALVGVLGARAPPVIG